MDQLPELGFYTLAGHSARPRDLVTEVRQAEEIGIGATFVSERFNSKDAAVLSGAAGAVSDSIGIATGATNHNTRHPLVTATFASTMHRLTGGRFALGLGRGFDRLFQAIGLNPITGAQLEDFVGLMRRLWHGETILGHDGPAGKYPYLHQDVDFDENIPIMLAALGPKSLELAGRCMDGVVLHTFYSDAAVTSAIAAVRRGAEAAGRDPASIRVWSVLATVTDEVAPEARLLKTVGRLGSYLQGYGDLMVRVNDWDPAVLAAFRADPFVKGFKGAFDAKATTAELEHLATLIPAHRLSTSATGT
nr:TIGR03857 family LLM class F420-dependent oxidoreductase [Micromonospora sp. DSM 115978]